MHESSGMHCFNRTVGTSINEDERYFENPTYEETSTRLSDSVSNEASENVNSSSTTYNTTHENGEDGPAYDVLSRAQATGIRKEKTHNSLTAMELAIPRYLYRYYQ